MSTEESLDTAIISVATDRTRPYVVLKGNNPFYLGELQDDKEQRRGKRERREQRQQEYPVLFQFLAEWNRINSTNYVGKESEVQSRWDFDCECHCKPCCGHPPLAIEIGKVVIDQCYMNTMKGTIRYFEKQVAPRISRLHQRNVVIDLSLPLPDEIPHFMDELVKEVERQVRGPLVGNPRVETSVLERRLVINQRESMFGSQTSFRVTYPVSMTRRYLRSEFCRQSKHKLERRQLVSASNAVTRIHLIDNLMGIQPEDASQEVASFGDDETKFVHYIFLVGPEKVVQLFP